MAAVSRSLLGILLAGVLLASAGSATSAACNDWRDWQNYRSRFISGDGRVIDHGSESDITTSEGQAYSLFFSLIANDRNAFDLLLKWTTNNLSKGNFASTLPAWKWGKRNDGSWGVMDANSSADADLWMAYSLAEAGRLWKNPSYSELASQLASRIFSEETVSLDRLGRTLLPAPHGFKMPKSVFRLNPSYYPIQVLRRMASLYPDSQWDQVVITSINTLIKSSERGFTPDWVLYDNKSGFMPDAEKKAVGSYDAIRVYLWAGMLAETEPARAVLIKKLDPMIQYIVQHGVPPLEVNTTDASASGFGPVGFSSAMLPLLAIYNQKTVLEQQRLRVVNAQPTERWDNYYDQVLTLFGIGWLEKRYRFDRDGKLMPMWNCSSS